MTSDPRVLGVILLEAEHSVETLGWDDPFSWQPPPGLGEGFYGHPAAWPLPVVFAVAEGATGKASAEGTPAAVQGVVDAIARLDGRCDLIVGGCGYFGAAWPALPAPPGTPAVLSSLDYLDDALRSTSRDVAVLSMSGPAATRFLADRPDAGRIRVVGLDDAKDWPLISRPDWATAPQWTLAGLEAGLRDVLAEAALPGGALDGVGAVVLECTVLPQFRAVVREYTRAPIVDVGTAVDALLA
ncbi:MAG TPA: hypothetical protein VFR07_14295 [Mycobacteriales bacterium]|jgi:hypothetical protein|nr:hypothetical protein [Mycobacteriales bacterium]